MVIMMRMMSLALVLILVLVRVIVIGVVIVFIALLAEDLPFDRLILLLVLFVIRVMFKDIYSNKNKESHQKEVDVSTHSECSI